MKHFSVTQGQRNYYHRPFLIKLFKTDSKPKLNSVTVFHYLLYCINFCFHLLGKIYSQKGEIEKRRAKEREGKA